MSLFGNIATMPGRMSRIRRDRCVQAFLLLASSLFALHTKAIALAERHYVETAHSTGNFTIAEKESLATIYVDASDHAGVVRATGDLQADIARVTGHSPAIINQTPTRNYTSVIIIGTIGKSAAIDQLIREKKIDVSPIAGKWESFLIQVVSRPLPGIASGLIIAGSDKRGTIFGIYDLSEQIGVSPWYWWADVPVAAPRRSPREGRPLCAGAARGQVSRHLPE